MKQLSKLLRTYLPRFYNFKYNDEPILYAYNKDRIIYLYSYNPNKKAIYFKEYNRLNKGYITVEKFQKDNWRLASKMEAFNYYFELNEYNLPF